MRELSFYEKRVMSPVWEQAEKILRSSENEMSGQGKAWMIFN